MLKYICDTVDSSKISEFAGQGMDQGFSPFKVGLIFILGDSSKTVQENLHSV